MNTHTNELNGKVVRNHLSVKEKVDLINAMSKVLTKTANGKSQYMKGWSDERVVKELGNGATILNVVNLRKVYFGALGKIAQGGGRPTTSSRITKLELRIAKLEARLDGLLQLTGR